MQCRMIYMNEIKLGYRSLEFKEITMVWERGSVEYNSIC